MLKIKYKLVGTGWSECGIDNGTKKIIITASYIGDALPDLAYAVLDIVKGKKKSLANFEEEPGQYRWVFVRKGKFVDLKILKFKHSWSEESDEKGKLLLSHSCTTEELVEAILKCLNSVLKKYTLKEYKNKWVSSFPLLSYKEIKKIIKEIITKF